MEVVLSEEKKKIFRARKTMKISDRQQLETLHSTLLTSSTGSSNSPPLLMNGTHKEDGDKLEDDQHVECVSPKPASPRSVPELSLNLSPSPDATDATESETKEELPVSPVSPFHCLNSELKNLEKQEPGSPSASSKLDVPSGNESEKTQDDNTKLGTESKVENTNEEIISDKGPDDSEPMETDIDSSKSQDTEIEPIPEEETNEEPTPPSSNEVPPLSPADNVATVTKTDIEEEIKAKPIPVAEIQDECLKEKVDFKTEVKSTKEINKQERPSSTPPSNTSNEERRSSGLKRTLSEGFEPNISCISREIKRPKLENEEYEAKLELKITAKAGSNHGLAKIVQKLVEEKLKVLEMTLLDRSLQELKDRVDQIDCNTKHHSAISTLQVKLARLAKKSGEANQASENKKKQEALAAAATAAAAAATATATAPVNATPSPSAPSAPTAKTVPGSPQIPKPARTSVEVKQTTTLPIASTSIPAPATVTPAITTPVPTTTALVSQTPILQLIASTTNAVSNLTASSTTQSPTSTLVLKNGMMATGQPLLIQLPLSMTNGQTGTLVNIPVSSLNAVTSLNKAKTTAPTTTFILKSAPTSTAVPSGLTATTLPALQAPVAQAPTTQISIARAVYPGGTGGITTPNSGVSVTSVRAPTQTVSVAGAMSSTSSPVTSVPAATGSTAPGPPQGTLLTTKTDNQVPGPSPSKASAPTARPKGSVIDLTEEDDDVLVTGVKSATVTPNTVRPQTSITSTAKSSPLSNQTSTGTLPLSTHQRPLLDPKSRNATSTPTRNSSVALPPLPPAPVPSRLPAEAEKTSPPQQPQLKLVPSHTGIALSWCVSETDLTCAAVDSYHLYAFHQDNSSNSNSSQQHWKKIGEVKALPLPMACTLTQFQTGSTYHFAVRAKDIYGRFGAFCEPQCTNVINSTSS